MERGATRLHHEIIDGDACEVYVSRKPRSFFAYGRFRGKLIEATGDSEASALGAWNREANHAANE